MRTVTIADTRGCKPYHVLVHVATGNCRINETALQCSFQKYPLAGSGTPIKVLCFSEVGVEPHLTASEPLACRGKWISTPSNNASIGTGTPRSQ